MQKTILAIDPGLSTAGFAIAKADQFNTIKLLDAGYLSFCKDFSIGQKLLFYAQFLKSKITEHQVNGLALETPFLGKNAQTFLKLGYLRAVTILIGQELSLPVLQLAPAQIKNSICKNPQASKDQVACALSMILPQTRVFKSCKHKDVTDACAIAVSALWGGE